MHLQAQRVILVYGAGFPIGGTVMIRNPKHVQQRVLYPADGAVCNLAHHSKENTVCAHLIESAANRRHPLWALSA